LVELLNLGIVSSAQAAGATVTGGTFYSGGGFNYRVFTASGTLSITGGTVTMDVLQIAEERAAELAKVMTD